VPIPVDRDAQVRGAAPQGAPSFAIEPALPYEEPPMTETTPEIPAAPPAPQAASPVTVPQVEAPPDLEALRAEAQRAERERIAAIDGAMERCTFTACPRMRQQSCSAVLRYQPVRAP